MKNILLGVTVFFFGLTSSTLAASWLNEEPDSCKGGFIEEREVVKVTSSCPFFTQWMKQGDRDGQISQYHQPNGEKVVLNEVTKLQSWLNQYFNTGLDIDGAFGPRTFSAVKKYQTTYQQYILDPWSRSHGNHATGNFKNTSEWFANHLMSCTDPEIDFDGDQSGVYLPFEGEDEGPALLGTPEGSEVMATEYRCRPFRSGSSGGSSSSTPAPVSTGEISVTKKGVFNDEIDYDLVGSVGETISYTYTITNTGPLDLVDISLAEVAGTFTGAGALPVPVYVSGDENLDGEGDDPDLATGSVGSIVFTATYTLVAGDVGPTSITNQAIATGTDPDGLTVTDSSDDTIILTTDDDPTVTSLALAYSCDANVYISQSTSSAIPTIIRSLSATGTFTDVGDNSHGYSYNSLGYNTADNAMYATEDGTTNILRVHSDGTIISLGAVPGLPAPAGVHLYAAGDFDAATGEYIVMLTSDQTQFFRVNVDANSGALPAPTFLGGVAFTDSITTLPVNLRLLDIAYNTIDGLMYGVDLVTDNLVKFDTVTGVVTTIGVTGTGGGFGAMFADPTPGTGAVYGSENTGGFYGFDLTTGVATLEGPSDGVSFNDGSHCPLVSI